MFKLAATQMEIIALPQLTVLAALCENRS